MLGAIVFTELISHVGYLYLVGFKGQSHGGEDDLNYALRALLDEHCSFCEPVGKYNIFENRNGIHHLSEICWLIQKIGYYDRDYYALIDELREQHEKVLGYKPESWFDTFHSSGQSRHERMERDERNTRWKSDRYRIFRRLIGSWIKPRRCFPKDQED